MRFAAALIVLIAVAPFDDGPWLTGLDRIRDAMSEHYANLEWVAGVRHVDLKLLYDTTRDVLEAATTQQQAQKALDDFADGMGDGHVWIDWTAPGSEGAAGISAPPDLCTRLDYHSVRLRAGVDFASTGRYQAISSGATRYFAIGILHLKSLDVGVIRIPIFGARPYRELCDGALSGLGLNENSPCDDPCSDAVEIAADDALTVQYDRALQALTNGRQLAALVVDITGNSGGSSWLEPAARELTATKPASPRMGFIEHPHWVDNFRDALAAIDDALPSASGNYRKLLLQARDTYRVALRRAAGTCDRSPLWDDRTIDCSLVVTSVPLTTSGILPYAEPGALPRVRATTYVFQPALYHYREGVYRGKLVVLIDNHTVSSAERFAAILQDARAATIAGVRSYGAGCGFTNGSIPTQIDGIGADVHLPDCIQLRADGTNAVAGITPDIAIPWRKTDTPAEKADETLKALAIR